MIVVAGALDIVGDVGADAKVVGVLVAAGGGSVEGTEVVSVAAVSTAAGDKVAVTIIDSFVDGDDGTVARALLEETVDSETDVTCVLGSSVGSHEAALVTDSMPGASLSVAVDERSCIERGELASCVDVPISIEDDDAVVLDDNVVIDISGFTTVDNWEKVSALSFVLISLLVVPVDA